MEDVGLSSEVSSEGPSCLSLVTPDGMAWAKTQKEPDYVFPGTTTCKTGKGVPVPLLLHNTPLMLGPAPCLCLSVTLDECLNYLEPTSPVWKALPCICGVVLRHALDVLVLHQVPVS